MYSEFYNVELDRIRYSLVWEDSSTLYNALDITPDDRVLVITSAGCNVLNALLKNPKSVTAIDLNPIQNRLLRFKLHVIHNHDYLTFQNILGINGRDEVIEAWKKIASTLSGKQIPYWAKFFESHPDGLFTSGKLEHYITSFYSILKPDIKGHLQKLTTFTNVKGQAEYFNETLDNSSFKPQFIQYFDQANLSKGRDPKLFKYATESGGETFYNRLATQISSSLVSTNFFFHFFFWGPENLPDNLLPPCYQEANYNKLKESIYKIEIVNGEAIDFLLSNEGKHINKASLSNIFEYTTNDEFNWVYKHLFTNREFPLRLIFWNLLNQQGDTIKHPKINTLLSEECLAADQACFYFKNICVIENPSEPTHNQ